MDKAKLEELYIDRQWSLRAIADNFGVSESTIHRLMVRYGIPRREQKKQKFNVPSGEDLKTLHFGEGKTLKEIAGIYGVNRNLVSKWFLKRGIQISYFKEMPPEETLFSMYSDNKLTIKQLMSVFNVGRNTIRKWLDHYGIPIRSPQRKFRHLRKVPMTRLQREFIVGTLLGDGYLGRKNILEVKHCAKQIEYLLWKKEIMGNYVNCVREHTASLKATGKTYTGFSWHTITLPELSFFRKLFYDNTKKVVRPEIAGFLTPFSMAVWFMDDGWRQKNSMKISSESFTYEENLLLKDMIKVQFDINAKVCGYKRNGKEYHYLSFNKRNSMLLSDLIKPYIITSMEYKLVPSSLILND